MEVRVDVSQAIYGMGDLKEMITAAKLLAVKEIMDEAVREAFSYGYCPKERRWRKFSEDTCRLCGTVV